VLKSVLSTASSTQFDTEVRRLRDKGELAPAREGRWRPWRASDFNYPNHEDVELEIQQCRTHLTSLPRDAQKIFLSKNAHKRKVVELASGIAAPVDGLDSEVTPLYRNPGRPTAAELRGLALRGRRPEQNVNPVAAQPMLEKGLYYRGRSYRAEVILNKQVASAPGLFQYHVDVAQEEFSEYPCTDAIACFYAGRSDDHYAGGMQEALDVFRRCHVGTRGAIHNFIALGAAYMEAVDASWPVADMQIDVFGLYVPGQGVLQVSHGDSD
jgi:hypothetical protein